MPDADPFASDCARCAGLCCTLLPLTRSREFPLDKPAGVPCRNLRADFGCAIHASLRPRGWLGCTEFECFGAGPLATALTTALTTGSTITTDRDITGRAADEGPTDPGERPETFGLLRLVQEVRYHLQPLSAALAEAGAAAPDESVGPLVRATDGDPPTRGPAELDAQLTARIADLDAQAGALADTAAGPPRRADVEALRAHAGELFTHISRRIRGHRRAGDPTIRRAVALRAGADLGGADLRGADLSALDLRGAFLAGADLRAARLELTDLLGADLRDSDVRGTELKGALFLTQSQVNAARGDHATTLAQRLQPPAHWG